MALHFIGFKDDRIWNARRIFGEPDFYHRIWDRRARQEVVEDDDVAVFATGCIDDPPKPISWDDSQQDIIARGGKEFFNGYDLPKRPPSLSPPALRGLPRHLARGAIHACPSSLCAGPSSV